MLDTSDLYLWWASLFTLCLQVGVVTLKFFLPDGYPMVLTYRQSTESSRRVQYETKQLCSYGPLEGSSSRSHSQTTSLYTFMDTNYAVCSVTRWHHMHNPQLDTKNLNVIYVRISLQNVYVNDTLMSLFFIRMKVVLWRLLRGWIRPLMAMNLSDQLPS